MRFAKVPKRPTEYVTSEELLHDLLLVLKDIVVLESMLTGSSGNGNGNGNSNSNGHKNGNGNGSGNPMFSESQFVKLTPVVQKAIDLYNRLSRRNLDLDEALVNASPQVGIDLRRLLHDCLQFPTVIPYARNLKGLRKSFLCHCGEQEALDCHGLGLCRECLETALECIQEKKKNTNFVLYNAHSAQIRCRHADFSTLLIAFYKQGQWFSPWCEICLKQEKLRLMDKV